MKSILIFSSLFALGSSVIGFTALSVYLEDQQEIVQEASLLHRGPSPEQLDNCILQLNEELTRCSKQAGHFVGDNCTDDALNNWAACTRP